MELFESFCAFEDSASDYFCDFFTVRDQLHAQQSMASLITIGAENYDLLGKDKSDSLILKRKIDGAIAWVDSEGTPNEMFAANEEIFFGLLEFNTRYIYDAISVWVRYRDEKKEPKEPLINTKVLDEQFPYRKRYIEWLEDNSMRLSDPFSRIGEMVTNNNELTIRNND